MRLFPKSRVIFSTNLNRALGCYGLALTNEVVKNKAFMPKPEKKPASNAFTQMNE